MSSKLVHANPVPLSAPQSLPDVSGAETDAQLVDLWLRGRSRHTQRAYRRDTERFLCFARKSLRSVSVADVENFAETLAGAASSRARTLSAIKSLLGYAHRVGYVHFNVGAPVQLPKLKEQLAERILPESDVHRMIALAPSQRDRVLLRLLYAAGVRVSEACALKWRDIQARDEAAQITVFGKGGKTRTVLLSDQTWAELRPLRGDAGPNDPAFRSRKGGHLSTAAVWYVVKRACERAGLDAKASPHWLRHAHASHALDRGAPIHLVQATLGHASVATTGRYLHARPNESSSKYLAV